MIDLLNHLTALGAQAQKARPVLWRAYRALGALYQDQGRDDAAREALAEARRIVMELAGEIPDEGVREGLLRAAQAE